jgi:hypothetical protein
MNGFEVFLVYNKHVGHYLASNSTEVVGLLEEDR